MIELGYGNAREGRSTSLAIDLRIKTCKNTLKSQIDPKANWGYFWWKFSNFSKSKKNLGDLWGKQSQIRGNHALIPNDEVWTSRVARSSRIDGGCGRTHARTRGTRRTPRRTPRTQEHTHDTRTVSLTGRSNRPNRIHTKVGDRQVDTRRDLGWLFLQRSTEPLQ
jgi:hypothetical protein